MCIFINLIHNLARPKKHNKEREGRQVLQSIEGFEKTEDKIVFVEAITQGLIKTKEGNCIDLGEAKSGSDL